MDQRPRDLPPKTDWDRLPYGDDGSWSLVPVLIVVALLAVGAWLLFANSATTPTTTATSERTPSPSVTPSPTPVAAGNGPRNPALHQRPLQRPPGTGDQTLKASPFPLRLLLGPLAPLARGLFLPPSQRRARRDPRPATP